MSLPKQSKKHTRASPSLGLSRADRIQEGAGSSFRPTSFLSPFRETQNLPSRAATLGPTGRLRTFVRAIFYVGKGSRARPDSHLWEALGHLRHPGRQVRERWWGRGRRRRRWRQQSLTPGNPSPPRRYSESWTSGWLAVAWSPSTVSSTPWQPRHTPGRPAWWRR